MPESPDIEEANPLLLESEDEYRSSLEYPPDTVDFDRNGDPENPLEWPGFYKWGVVALLSFLGFTVYVSILALWKYLPKANYIQHIHMHLVSPYSRPYR